MGGGGGPLRGSGGGGGAPGRWGMWKLCASVMWDVWEHCMGVIVWVSFGVSIEVLFGRGRWEGGGVRLSHHCYVLLISIYVISFHLLSESACTCLGFWHNMLIGGFGNGKIRIYNSENGRELVEIAAHARWINSLDVSDNGMV